MKAIPEGKSTLTWHALSAMTVNCRKATHSEEMLRLGIDAGILGNLSSDS